MITWWMDGTVSLLCNAVVVVVAAAGLSLKAITTKVASSLRCSVGEEGRARGDSRVGNSDKGCVFVGSEWARAELTK